MWETEYFGFWEDLMEWLFSAFAEYGCIGESMETMERSSAAVWVVLF